MCPCSENPDQKLAVFIFSDSRGLLKTTKISFSFYERRKIFQTINKRNSKYNLIKSLRVCVYICYQFSTLSRGHMEIGAFSNT